MNYIISPKKFQKTLCCSKDPKAVIYNELNKVVQCNHCGHVWEPLLTTEGVIAELKERIKKL